MSRGIENITCLWRFCFILQTAATIDSCNGDWTSTLSCFYKLYFWKIINFFFWEDGCNHTQSLHLPPLPAVETGKPQRPRDCVALWHCFCPVFQAAFCQSPSLQCADAAACFLRPGSPGFVSVPGRSPDFNGTMLYFTINQSTATFHHFCSFSWIHLWLVVRCSRSFQFLHLHLVFSV